MKGKRGQSTLEYIIVFTAIVAGILLIAYNTLKPGLQKVYDQSNTELDEAATRFGNLNP